MFSGSETQKQHTKQHREYAYAKLFSFDVVTRKFSESI